MEHRYAEDANYWQTTVPPAKSQAEIIELLADFGVDNSQISQGKAGEQTAWLIRFEWCGHSYRFLFTPLDCKSPEVQHAFGSAKRKHSAQAVYQMGRIAVYFTKAILTAAEAHPHALFGFMELPGTEGAGNFPHTAAELDVTALPSALSRIALPSPEPGRQP